MEIACGLLFVLAYSRFEAGTALASALILLAGLVAITAIDLDHQIIPDVLSLPGIALGVLFSLAPGGIGWASPTGLPSKIEPASPSPGVARCPSAGWTIWSMSTRATRETHAPSNALSGARDEERRKTEKPEDQR